MGYGHIEDQDTDSENESEDEDQDPYTQKDEELLSMIVQKKKQGQKIGKDDNMVAKYLMQKRENHRNGNGGYNYDD